MAKKYRSDAFAAIHETVEALHNIGAIDKQTMREFDDACLTPVHGQTGQDEEHWLWLSWGKYGKVIP
jgi:putative transcriptional regulator